MNEQLKLQELMDSLVGYPVTLTITGRDKYQYRTTTILNEVRLMQSVLEFVFDSGGTLSIHISNLDKTKYGDWSWEGAESTVLLHRL
ncbi:hypothetical protein [Ammoniphilus sp. CFH 90114]|uniref:hypothetical protein n=1 Tax=Ammoniphilus sp. CFH 90114 TaxID=2493665 RepID=UPI00100ED6A2|nr:hypothetical protein [Ammoniphilus sp. CFH 90114]RXT15390.1 hypothetical protein EIZ39_04105 [Ammoniphilus sp. CFH 90114]